MGVALRIGGTGFGNAIVGHVSLPLKDRRLIIQPQTPFS
jgi:hypothetical protein